MIIHIDGVQGSGKSYLCSQLKMKCIDTDDIATQAYNTIEKSQKTKQKIPRTMYQIKKISNKIIQSLCRSGDIVFVGMTATIPNPDIKYFIKITDFKTVFKRLVSRELDKIIKNQTKIKKAINNMENPKMDLIKREGNLSVPFPPNYNDFISDYKERSKVAKKNGYELKTQEQIIQQINNLK